MRLALWLWAGMLSGQGFDGLANQARQALEGNRAEEAVRAAGAALKLRPDWAEGWWILGTVHYDRDEHEACRDAFTRQVTLEPKAGPSLAFLGFCEFQLREYDAALRHLEAGLEAGIPADSQLMEVTFFHLAQLWTKAGQFERGLRFLSGFRAEQAGPAMVLTAGLAGLRRAMLPSEVAAGEQEMVGAMGKAVFLAVTKRESEAEPLYREVASRWGEVANVNHAFAAFLAARNPEEAVERVRRELKRDPDHVPSLLLLASLKKQESAWGEAEAALRRVVKLRPEDANARLLLGQLLLSAGNAEGAVTELEGLAAKHSEMVEPHVALSTAYYKLRRKEDGDRERKKVQELKAKAGGS